jgi:hypothetical protein
MFDIICHMQEDLVRMMAKSTTREHYDSAHLPL